jgi:hypothetical protein
MHKTLDELRELLAQGRLLSGQGSYDRQAPALESKPLLLEAQTKLRAYTDAHPDDEQGWRLRSQAEECVLNFTMALHCLERAMELSGKRERKDLKNLARLQEYMTLRKR